MSDAAAAYHVVYSGQVRESIKAILRQAKKAGKLSRFGDALQQLDDRLRSDPLGFGELTGRLPWSKVPVHVGFVRPLKVDFAIHETQRVVFVRKIEVLPLLD
jgi:hypothetical protein